MSVRVELPAHLCALARCGREITVEVAGTVTLGAVLDALEAEHPMLAGTIREHGTVRRRAFLRFFAEEEDWSHVSFDVALPDSVAQGRTPLLVVGAIAGG